MTVKSSHTLLVLLELLGHAGKTVLAGLVIGLQRKALFHKQLAQNALANLRIRSFGLLKLTQAVQGCTKTPVTLSSLVRHVHSANLGPIRLESDSLLGISTGLLVFLKGGECSRSVAEKHMVIAVECDGLGEVGHRRRKVATAEGFVA